MALPINRTQFKDTILQRLGSPVIRVNVSDSQIDNAIDEALLFYKLYFHDGTERTYLVHPITQPEIDSKSIILPDSVSTVTSIGKLNNIGGSNGDTIFSFEYQFFANSMSDILRIGGISDLVVAKQYMADIENMLNSPVVYRFNYNTSTLHIDYDLKSYITVGKYLLIECYKNIDEATYTKVWADRYLRNLAAAYLKRSWGINLSKFNGVVLPGGSQLNGKDLYLEAMGDIEKAEQDIIDNQEPFGIITA